MTTTEPPTEPAAAPSAARTSSTTTKRTAPTAKAPQPAAAPAANTGPSLGAAAGATLRALNPVTIAKTILPVRQTPVQQIGFYGTVMALAALEIIEPPLAAVVIAGHLLHRSRNPLAESVDEALDEAR